jgi:AraC-like DNA-binding protein
MRPRGRRIERNCGIHRRVATQTLPTVRAWDSRFGLVEEYEYPPGPADSVPAHAHREMQICFSLDFPGRYAYRGELHDVPIGAVSILESWEPHAASDPCDRDRASHYVVVYLDPEELRRAVDLPPDAPAGAPVRTDTPIANEFRALYRALMFGSALEQDERYRTFACAALSRRTISSSTPTRFDAALSSLCRARDYIEAHALERIGLAEIAAQADLSPWHFARAFHRRFGLPPHRFQLWMRIDRARHLLAAGMPSARVAHLTGFADQSHFVRCFKKMVRTTPRRYRGVLPSRLSALETSTPAEPATG